MSQPSVLEVKIVEVQVKYHLLPPLYDAINCRGQLQQYIRHELRLREH